MITTHKRLKKFMVAAVIMAAAISARAGDLNPPGAPGSTMKTLTEVYDRAQAAQTAADAAEPRTPISGAMTITQPGSYYLATNSTGTITIQANNVTLDLMGFRLAVASGDAIDIPSGYGTNTLIRNGTLRASGSSIALDGRYADDCIFEDLRIEGNNAFGGIYADDRCVVRNCEVRGCDRFGIHVGNQTEVSGCRVIGGTLDGIQAESNCRIIDNVIEDHGDDGLNITGSGCYVAGNFVKGNVDNYDIAANNQLNLLLCEIPETLDRPCSVKFAGTLKTTQTGIDGITVAADDVTIDLDGHTLIGPGADSGNGIYQSEAYRNLHVFNGKIIYWQGTNMKGINADGKAAILSDLQAAINNSGIWAKDAGTISGCTAYSNGFHGINTYNGCTISACTAYGNGHNGIDAFNGCTISGCAAYGNDLVGIRAYNGTTISGCEVNENGRTGIWAYDGATISHCQAYNNASNGIYTHSSSVISSCEASENNATGIYVEYGGRISDCAVSDNGDDGIYVNVGGTISGCMAYHNDGCGIVAGRATTVADCTAKNNTEDGINVTENCLVTHCTATENGYSDGDGAGIHATYNDSRIEGNNVSGNDRGIDVDRSGNFITRNTCSGNSINWTVVAGNACLVVQATTGAAISGNSGGTAPGSTDPNANFTY